MERRDYRIRWRVIGAFAGAILIAIVVGRFFSTTAASIIVVGTLVLFALVALLSRYGEAIGFPVDGFIVGSASDGDAGSDIGDVGGDFGGGGDGGG